MRISLVSIFFLLLFIITDSDLAFSDTAPQESCNSVKPPILVDEIIATANFWDNFRKNKGSLSYESIHLLSIAKSNLNKQSFECSSGSVRKKILFQTVPNKFLKNYTDKDYCLKILEQTKKKPFYFTPGSFSSIENLYDWFSKFSQGNGEEGRKLYEFCDKSCSPRYYNTITLEQNEYSLETKTVCGPARDKEDNNYTLQVSFLLECCY